MLIMRMIQNNITHAKWLKLLKVKYFFVDTLRFWLIARFFKRVVTFRFTRVYEMKRIPVNANPYHYDGVHMGMGICNGWELMYSSCGKQLEYVIFINTRTGKRIKVVLPQD